MTDISGVSFSADILPLFSRSDIQHMNVFGVRLGQHEWMSHPANAKNVYSYLTGESTPRMPLGGPYWSQGQLDLFARWIKTGYRP